MKGVYDAFDLVTFKETPMHKSLVL